VELGCLVQHWGVDIRVNGERALTIESNSLSGINNIADYADTVLECAHHLLAFIGDGVAEPLDTMELDTTPNTARDEILQYLNMALGAIKECGPITASGYIEQAIAKLSPVA